MRKVQVFSVCVMCGIAAVSAGCVSLDDHRQLQMAHRTLEAEKAQLEQELYDLRGSNSNLQNQLTSTERHIQSKETLASNLQAENNRLQAAVGSAQRTVEELARQNVLQDPIIIESTKLPEALDTALQDFAAKHPGSVTYDARNGVVKWTSDLVFALGSDIVKNSAKGSLDEFAKIIRSPAAKAFDVLVIGHTDDRPIKRAETLTDPFRSRTYCAITESPQVESALWALAKRARSHPTAPRRAVAKTAAWRFSSCPQARWLGKWQNNRKPKTVWPRGVRFAMTSRNNFGKLWPCKTQRIDRIWRYWN